MSNDYRKLRILKARLDRIDWGKYKRQGHFEVSVDLVGIGSERGCGKERLQCSALVSIALARVLWLDMIPRSNTSLWIASSDGSSRVETKAMPLLTPSCFYAYWSETDSYFSSGSPRRGSLGVAWLALSSRSTSLLRIVYRNTVSKTHCGYSLCNSIK